MAELPEWFDPLARRATVARRSDFTRWPTPPIGGRKSAVLILLGEQPDNGPDVLVLQRAAALRNHAGQPAFPGGGSDPEDADAVATALREANEEVGLDPATTVAVAGSRPTSSLASRSAVATASASSGSLPPPGNAG